VKCSFCKRTSVQYIENMVASSLFERSKLLHPGPD